MPKGIDYDEIAGSYNELHKEEQLKKLKIIKENMKVSKNSKLLDVGCGTGISSDFGCFVVGIDSSEKLINLNPLKRKIIGTAEFLPFKDSSFGFVISVTAIHNFNDIKKSLHEMKRVGTNDFVFSVLKKSGKFVIIRNLIKSQFQIIKELDEEKDFIFFCKRKN
ncbi:MAG TPA: class I SAM-dependent methyltransferase [Candidatus Nanoarchaeia archaeon]|nr:class I SAM-dependent methyltransferase [Candidatus Nanoarchaeia archaeon]